MTYYFIHLKRGKEAMEVMDILPQFMGVSVYDGWSSYASYDTALEEAGIEGFLVALRQVVKVNKGVREVAQELSIGRESLYKSLSENGNPGLSTINNVLHSVGIGLTFTLLPVSSSEDVLEA